MSDFICANLDGNQKVPDGFIVVNSERSNRGKILVRIDNIKRVWERTWGGCELITFDGGEFNIKNNFNDVLNMLNKEEKHDK